MSMLVKSELVPRAGGPPPQRITGAPESRTKTGAVLRAKTLSQQLGMPPTRSVGALAPILWRPLGVGQSGLSE
eukprot:14784804-Alexandrium_andersonii.AAC.1